ncbi:MAG: electron transport complex subunit RsxC [Ruminococcaceae bacterium]|nr:electron transport complex subunit RsxC [Oscillospiraceae bacterium]
MKFKTFRGGTHPHDCKQFTQDKPIVKMEPSKIMVYPMSQHIGAPCTPTVKVGDSVLMGQVIGESDAFVSAPVHSTVSGKVVAVEKRLHTNGTNVMSVVIENDFQDTKVDTIKEYDDENTLTRQEKLDLVKKAGIVGLGGATFPTHIKLNPPADKKIDTFVINGAECEPYLTSDYRVMLETPVLVFEGIKQIMSILGVKKACIGIENNKPEAIDIMTKLSKNYEGVEVCPLKTKYPQGSEKHLIKAITGREVPSGKLPADVGVVVDNIDTCTAVYNAIKFRQPVFTRVVTVSGMAVKNPGNYYVRLGTGFDDILKTAEYDEEKTVKVIAGGPMMGLAQSSLNVPAIKGTSAVLALTKEEVNLDEEVACTRCGKCVSKCPMGLMPVQLNSFAKIGDMETCLKYDVMDCIECGVCSFTCPSGNHITQRIKLAKRKIAASRKK